MSNGQSGWTHGPWIAEEAEGFWGVFQESDCDGIAMLWDGHLPLRPESTEANARLIAAAPDLYEALVEARAALHQHYVDWDGEPEDAVPLQLARSKCDAALSKARGQS